MKTKLLSIVFCAAMLATFFTAFNVPALAKTDYSPAAPSLIINILNPDWTTRQVYTYAGQTAGTFTDPVNNQTWPIYAYPELEALADIYYYSTIDAMPAAVGTRALGVPISALVSDLNTNHGAGITWASGQQFLMYPTDSSAPYQGSNFYTFDFVEGQPRYYYPDLVEKYTAFKDNDENTSDLTGWDSAPVSVPPVICLSAYQERYTTDAMLKSQTPGTYTHGIPGTPDYREITTPVEINSIESLRFCMGLTPAEAQQGIDNTYSSTNKFCRWVYRMDFGPVCGPTLYGDSTDTVDNPIDLTFTDNANWRDAITGITVDGAEVDPAHYTISAGAIEFDDTTFTTGSHAVVVAATGFMNNRVTQKIGSLPPALTADSTNIQPGQTIDITFKDNATWRAAISDVTVNGSSVPDYSLAAGKLSIPGSYFPDIVDPNNGNYVIVVAAAGYLDARVTQNIANKAPVLSVNSARMAATPFSIVFTNNPLWRAAITDIKVAGVSKYSDCTITDSAITFEAGALDNGTQTITVTAKDYPNTSIHLPGVVTPDTTGNVVGQSIELTYPSDTNWYSSISSVTVNGNSIAGHYTKNSSKLTIDNSVFSAPGIYTVALHASGYADGIVIQMINCTLTYTAGANGTISGITPQTVAYGGSGSTVSAVADSGYHFVNWSDGGLTAARTDTNVQGNITVTAAFTQDSSSGGGGGGGGGGETPPAISAVIPRNSATGVEVNSPIKAVFSKAMNAGTINTTNFTLMNGATAVNGSVTYDSASRTATFTQSEALNYSTVYTASIKTGVISSSGYRLNSSYIWSFSTAEAPTPTSIPPLTTSPTPGPTATPYNASGAIDLAEVVGETGQFTSEITVDSSDHNAAVRIGSGVTALTSKGTPISRLTVENVTDQPGLNGNFLLGSRVYNFGPNGASFDPPIVITINYDPGLLPPDYDAGRLVVGWYAENTQEWVKLASTVDYVNHSVSAQVTHFTGFAVLAQDPQGVSQIGQAKFEVSQLAVDSPQVESGQAINISATVSNIGSAEGSYKAELKINGAVADSQDVELKPGQERQINFKESTQAAGNYNVEIGGVKGSYSVQTSPSATTEGAVTQNSTDKGTNPVIWLIPGGLIVICAVIVIVWRKKIFVRSSKK